MDKSPVVAAAVLCSAQRLNEGPSAEIIKRWVNEVTEAAQSKQPMVQFHAVALLHGVRATDRLAISKLVTSLTKANIKAPLAQCLLVRYVSQVGWERGSRMWEPMGVRAVAATACVQPAAAAGGSLLLGGHRPPFPRRTHAHTQRTGDRTGTGVHALTQRTKTGTCTGGTCCR